MNVHLQFSTLDLWPVLSLLWATHTNIQTRQADLSRSRVKQVRRRQRSLARLIQCQLDTSFSLSLCISLAKASSCCWCSQLVEKPLPSNWASFGCRIVKGTGIGSCFSAHWPHMAAENAESWQETHWLARSSWSWS